MAAAPKRRWYQFSLRGLFITITVGSLVGLLCVAPAQRQRAAVHRIERLGGVVWYSSAAKKESWSIRQLRRWLPRDFFDTVEGINLYATSTKNADLAHLRVFADVTQIDLIGTPVTDSGLIHLQRLTRLRELSLDGTQITGAGLAHLHNLKQLKGLSITNTRTTDASIADLQKALPDCRIIR